MNRKGAKYKPRPLSEKIREIAAREKAAREAAKAARPQQVQREEKKDALEGKRKHRQHKYLTCTEKQFVVMLLDWYQKEKGVS